MGSPQAGLGCLVVLGRWDVAAHAAKFSLAPAQEAAVQKGGWQQGQVWNPHTQGLLHPLGLR